MGYRGYGALSRPGSSEGEAWRRFDCGHCGSSVSGLVVTSAQLDNAQYVYWLQCPACGWGSVMNRDVVTPTRDFGPVITGLPSPVDEAYEEARRAMSVASYVATELVCRKILMHVAVEKGAKEGSTFAEYITHLEEAGYVTPPMAKWVGLIRTRGNEATHELTPVTQERAESTLMFTAELLRLTYEMESMADKYAPVPVEEQ